MLSGDTEVPLVGAVLPACSSQELRSEGSVAWKPALGFLGSLHTDCCFKSESDSKHQSKKERKQSDSQSLACITLGFTAPCNADLSWDSTESPPCLSCIPGSACPGSAESSQSLRQLVQRGPPRASAEESGKRLAGSSPPPHPVLHSLTVPGPGTLSPLFTTIPS